MLTPMNMVGASSYGSTFGPTYGSNGVRLTPAMQDEKEAQRKEQLGIKDEGGNGKNGECETCKNRKYQDGSNENVSYKAPTRISSDRAASAVMAHEQEHVSNAYEKAAKGNGKVVNASVSIHTAICPECGRSYVSGGTTNTQIKYRNEDNPYQKELKAQDKDKYTGLGIDYAV